MTSSRAWLPKKEPWLPPDRDDAVIWATLAFSKGAATEGQQILLWDYFMYLTGAGDTFADLSFRPGADGQRATDFAEGKRFVGLELRSNLHPARRPKEPVSDIKPTENPVVPARKKRAPRVKRKT